MRVQFWGTRGSIAKPGPSMARYGGNTSCVEVRSARGTLVIVRVVPAKLATRKSDGFILSGKRSHWLAARAHDPSCPRQ